jgi:branched-chain amino acid transport system ATP-binding protein
VLVEHVMRVVTALAERIVVLDQGRVLGEGRTADVMTRPDVAVVYLGVPHA